jgi:hypothetical protein
MKKIFKSLLIFSLFFVFVDQVNAADISLTCNETDGCTPDITTALFNQEDIYPGWESEPKTLEVTNEDDEDLQFRIKSGITSSNSILQEVLTMEIDGNSYDFNNEEFTDIATIPASQTNTFDLIMKMDNSAGNKYQGEKLIFDLTLNFESDSVNSPEPDGNDSGEVTTSSTADTGTGTGGVLGMILGASDDAETKPDTDQTGAEPVLAEENDSGQVNGGQQDKSNQVKGENVSQNNCFWWLVLGIIGLTVNSLYVFLNKNKFDKTKTKWLIPALVSLLIFLGDKLAHQWFVPSNHCSFMWLISLLTFSLPLSFYRLVKK